MFKTTLKSIVALALTSTSAMALDVTGTYRSVENGQPVAVELSGEGTVRGAMIAGGVRMPLSAKEQNGQLQGTLLTPDGRQIVFLAARNGNGLVFQTAGGQLMLSSDKPTGRREQVIEQPPAPRAFAGPSGIPADVQLQQGQVFAIPVPAGWTMTQSINECFSVSPDGRLAFGFVGLERIQASTPEQFLQTIIALYKHSNLRILASQPIRYPGATSAVEVKFAFTSSAGQPTVGWARIAVTQVGGQMNAYLLCTTGTPDAFDANAAQLLAMAEKIQITNAQLAFDRNRVLDNIRNIPNRPMDHSFTDAYWKNSKRMDDVMKRGSDVRRDQYTWTDPVTGERYHGGQNNIDPTRGGVPNPNRPTENLNPEPHWQKE